MTRSESMLPSAEELADALAHLIALGDASAWGSVVQKLAPLSVTWRTLDMLVRIFAQLNKDQHDEIRNLRARLVALEQYLPVSLNLNLDELTALDGTRHD